MAGFSLNECTIIGRCGAAPKIYRSEGRDPMAMFSVGTNTWNGTGTETEWIRCVAFGKTAETIEKYVPKGKEVYIRGALQTRDSEGKDGVKYRQTQVVVKYIGLMGKKGDGERGEDGGRESERGRESEGRRGDEQSARREEDRGRPVEDSGRSTETPEEDIAF